MRAAPWDLVTAPGALDDARLEAIEAEARARGLRPASPEAMLQLEAAGAAVHELVGGRAGAAVWEYGALVFHVLCFRREGQAVYEIDAELLRTLTGPRAPTGRWRLEAPAAAGYARLPERLLWARVSDEAPPEPVDGFFWSVVAEGDTTRVDLLACLGLWPGRPGFSVVPVGAVAPPDPGHWADEAARPEGEDFANVLPGGELDRLLALTTPLEALKLASRLFHYTALHPEAVEVVEAGPRRVRPVPGDG